MAKIDVSFILLSVLCLIAGLLLGTGMGATHNFQFATVHAHLNLVGFVSLALFGLIYKAYPALKTSWLAKVHFVLSGSAGILFPLGVYIAVAYENPALGIVMALVAIAGALVFLANLVRVFFFASNAAQASEEALA